MIPLPYRGTGIFVLVYLSAAAWIVGIWFDKRTFHDPSYTGWTFFSAGIACLLHAFGIIINRRNNSGHGAMRRTIWYETFLFIPVLIWPLLLIGFGFYNFFIR